MGKTRKKFAWSAGGLDASATDLKDLKTLDAELLELKPTEDMYYKDMRRFLESRGYIVRTKIMGNTQKRQGKKHKWVSVPYNDLRHRASVGAANERLQLERTAEKHSGPLPQNAAEVCFFWWTDASGRKLLSDNNVMGLQTACEIGGLQPVLYAYERPDNLPARVTWRDAKDVMPIPEYESYIANKHAIARIADLGRLRGMKKAIEEGNTYVWFSDLDV